MRLQELGEFGFIEHLRRGSSAESPGLEVGIGDDCAVLIVGSKRLVVTTDAMAEGRHFRCDWLTPHEIGARAVTAGLSDIAAMGATPRYILATLGLPLDWTAEAALQLGRGLTQQAERHGAGLAGGDTVGVERGAFVDIVAIGQCAGPAWLRSHARVGDAVYVTGRLGGPAAAVAARLAGTTADACWDRYARPMPRCGEASRLRPLGLVRAAIDVSDGLMQDAGHICAASGVGMVLCAADVPVYAGVSEVAQRLGTDALLYALTGGEEFELLFTAPAEALPELQAAAHLPVSRIGEVVGGDSVVVVGSDGQRLDLGPGGWDHFRIPTP